MSSKPPKKSLPPGLAILDLTKIHKPVQSFALSTSPSSETTITPITSSSSFELAVTPDSGGHNPADRLTLNPRRFFSSPGWMTARGSDSPRTVIKGESPHAKHSSSPSHFSDLFRFRSDLTEKDKRSGKKKERKEKIKEKLMILNFKEDVLETREYPPGHRGFLEIYAEKFGFSPRLRQILGINSFAEIASLEQYSSEMTKLDLETKVLVSISSIIRISSIIKGEIHKKLLDSLRVYDRSMSHWLSQDDAAMNAYQNTMRAIFFESEEKFSILDFFYSIPQYKELDSAIRSVLMPEKYQMVYNKICDSLEEYRTTFSLELFISDLKNVISINEKTIAELKKEAVYSEATIKELEAAIISMDVEMSEKSKLLNENIRDNRQFTQNFFLKEEFFNKFLDLRNEEVCEDSKVVDKKLENLPVWNEGSLSEENILRICLYFFRAICNKHPKFYDIRPGEKCSGIYVNEKFSEKWKTIKNTEKFARFMQEQKKCYNAGLLEIVLCKTLEYISENAQISIDYSLVIGEALEKAINKFPRLFGVSLHHYNKAFFKEAARAMFKSIQPSLEQSAEIVTTISGPAPKFY